MFRKYYLPAAWKFFLGIAVLPLACWIATDAAGRGLMGLAFFFLALGTLAYGLCGAYIVLCFQGARLDRELEECRRREQQLVRDLEELETELQALDCS
jgi:hypothetical protein